MTNANAQKPMSKKTKTKTRRNPARGVLWIIALLLFTSGFLRLSGDTGLAIAEEVTDLVNAAAETGADVPDEMMVENCVIESDIALILERLEERESMLEARESAMQDRMQALAVAETKVNESLQALVTAESELKSTMALAETAAEDDLARLTAVYENMKAKEAAALFETMDPQFAAGFLGRMRPESAASVMAGLAPQTAYTISVVLAGRNANAPTE